LASSDYIAGCASDGEGFNNPNHAARRYSWVKRTDVLGGLMPIPLEVVRVTVRSLERPEAIDTCETLSRAILLARRNRPEVEVALRELDVEQIRDTQTRVLRNEILPVF